MEIEEYIRTDKGIISKINSGVDIDMIEFENAIIGNVVKHSKNIYDLIEHEDIVILEYYVQKYGKRIQRKFDVIKYDDEGLYFENAFNHFIYKKVEKGFINGKWYNPKIKSILTKELFNQNSYKIGE